jgi:hypothetical protein
MRVEKASFGNFVLLMPEEQKQLAVIEAVIKLKETGKVVLFISGSEGTPEVICKLIKSSTLNK